MKIFNEYNITDTKVFDEYLMTLSQYQYTELSSDKSLLPCTIYYIPKPSTIPIYKRNISLRYGGILTKYSESGTITLNNNSRYMKLRKQDHYFFYAPIISNKRKIMDAFLHQFQDNNSKT